jgi:hypothetical protein
MGAYLNKYHVAIDGQGYVIAHDSRGRKYYQKKKAPVFVNKFGSGDSSYRDSTFWQYWASTNWRNGAKQLRVDDGGKFWKSSNVNVNQLEQLTLSRKLTSIGQTAAGIEVNALAAWRNSVSWWNSNYGYRQQVTVTAPALQQVPSGYPIKITIDTSVLQAASKVRSDRKDWRVIYDNGSSLVELTRDYIGTTTTFFALQAAIPAGASDSNYYVYYGYATESTDKQPATEADWNAVYAMYGTTPDADTKALWHFKEGSGSTINDDSAQTNTLTSVNQSWGTDGKLGRWLSLPRTSSSDNMTASSSADFSLGSFTIEFWINFISFSGDEMLFYRRRSGGASGDFGFQAFQRGSNLTAFTIADNTGTTHDADYTGVLNTGQWYHMAFTCDGTNMRIFIDGTQVASSTTPNVTATQGTFYLGADERATTTAANAKFQHARVSDVARSSFPYALASDPSTAYGTEVTTQPPSSSFDLYAGGSDGILYKWDGSSTFTPVFDTRRLTWFESGNDTDMKIGDVGGTETAQAQSFQLSTAAKVKGVELYLKKNAGTPTDITVRIETETSSKPSGTLADTNLTATIPAFTTTSYGWITVEFANASALLTAATKYWIVVKIASGPNDQNYAWAADGSSPTYSSGNMATSTDGGSTWTADSAKDAYFRLKGETTSLNCLCVSSIGGTQKMLIGTGSITSQVNGDARLFTFDGTTYSLEKTFATSTESQILKIGEYNASGKLYALVGPQGRVYEGTAPATWTLSKDINQPQNPGYPYALKEYNGRLNVVGGSPEFLPDRYYNGFWQQFDTTTWTDLYPFAFTVIKCLEFYDAFLFAGTYRGDIFVFDTSTLNPLFNFKDDYAYAVSILDMKQYDDKIYFLLYPQSGSGDTNSTIWVFDRHGMSSAHSTSGVNGYRCAEVVNNFLMIGTGSDGKVYKLDTSAYVSQGWLQTSYFDAGLPSIDKLYNSVTIQHDPLVAGQSIVIYYKFKESDNWTTLGTSDTVGSTSKTLSFASGTYSHKISLKIELNTTDSSVTPLVKEYVLQYTLYPSRKWLWTFRVYAKKGLVLLDRTKESRDATTIRSDIETSQNSFKLVTFVDVDGTSYNVLFSEIDQSSWVVNQSGVNEDEIAVTLLEA